MTKYDLLFQIFRKHKSEMHPLFIRQGPWTKMLHSVHLVKALSFLIGLSNLNRQMLQVSDSFSAYAAASALSRFSVAGARAHVFVLAV